MRYCVAKSLKWIICVLSSVLFFTAEAQWTVNSVADNNAGGGTAGTLGYCLENAPNGATITFDASIAGQTIQGAHWAVTQNNLTIDGRADVIVDGSFTYEPNTWTLDLFVISGSNVEFNNVHIRNSTGPNAWNGHGFLMAANITDITFNNCSATDCDQAGFSNSLWVSPADLDGGTLANITLVDCEASGNVLSGVQLNQTDNVQITRGEFYHNGWSGIHFERGVTNAVINEATCYQNGIPTLSPNTAAGGNNGAGITIDAQPVGGTPSVSTDIEITNCTVYENNIHGIECRARTSETHISNCEVYDNGNHPGGNGNQAAGVVFQFGQSTDCTVAECNIYGNADPGIYMYRFNDRGDHNNNVFYNNTIDNNGGGVVILSSSESYIIGNVITNSHTSTNGIPGNGNGIFIGDSSANMVIYDNVILSTDAPKYGIQVSNRGIDDDPLTGVGSDNAHILGNYIGIDKTGTVDANLAGGIRVERSDSSRTGFNVGLPPLARVVPGYGPINVAFPNDRNFIAANVGNGIEIELGNKNQIANNYIGTNLTATATAGFGNGQSGIAITSSTDIEIGVQGRNIISGNGNYGISLTTLPTSTTASVENNLIGTDVTGLLDFGNTNSGIFLTGCRTIGITNNVVSGNGVDGIELGNAAANTAADIISMLSNIVGLGEDGTTVLQNDRHGINVDNAAFIEIGDGTFANKNIISGNVEDGINISNNGLNVDVDFNFVGFDSTGTLDRGNGNIGINMTGANTNSIVNNYVGNSGNHGVSITSAATASNTIQNNVIGLFYTGAVPAGNAFNDGDGIHMEDCTDNTIGGTLATGNIIGYNTANGVNVGVTSNLNTISGNYIGINTDSSPIPNGGNGVVIDGTSYDNQIGGQWNADEGNYISNNALNGIFINANNTQTNNTIQGNTVGLDIARTGDFPNGIDGIRIEQGRGNTIGGDRGNFEGNFIAGSHVYQVHLLDGASFNNVYGNSIGNNDGVGTLVFDSGINAVMVEDGSQFNKIGGAGDSLNIIAHDTNAAVVIRGASNFNFVSNNYFGLSYDQDTELGNIDTAIAIYNSSNSFIGTDNPNVVPTSEYHAIYVTGGANSTGTIIENNLIGWEPAGGSQDNIGIGQHGIFVDGAQSSNVSNNQISNILNDHNAVHMEGVAGGAVNTIYANQITTGNNTLTGHGIRVLDMSGGSLLVDSNYVDQADSTGIQLHNVTVSATAFENILTSNGLSGLEASNATDLTIDDNWVGTDATDADLGNTLSGIWIHNTLGANTVTIENNLVNYNDIYGIHIDGELGGASFINTNFVGVQSDEVTAAGNDNNGIHVNDVTVVLTIGTANVIGGNSGHGINLNNTSNAVITENYIGVSFTNGGADTTDLGNTENGVNIENGSSDNVVGNAFANTAAGLTNFIAYNPIAVNVDGAAADNNTITQNSMFCNDNGDLGGIIHANDGNNNYPAPGVANWDVSVPVIVQGANGNAQMQLPDSLTLSDGVRVDVYTHDYACDNCRQGMIHGFSETVNGGNIALDLGWGFDTTDARCSSYTMTVTDAAGNTSEFSTCSKCFASCEPLNAYYDAPSPFVDTIELCLGTDYTLTAHDSVQVTIDNVVWMDALTNTPLVTQTTSGFDYIPAQPVSGDTMSFYFVYYQDLGCVTISDTVTLVYLDAPTFSLNQDTATCETAAVDVVASNTVNAGGGITWFTTGAGTFTNTGLDGTATYTPTTGEIGSSVYVGYQAEGLNPTSSCNLVRDSVSIRIDEQPDVILPADDSVCVGEELNPITATGTLISNLTWSANITSQIDNANVTYTGITGAGIVNIIATTEANGRCLADDDTISIEVNELPTPTINGITTICGNDISTFNVTTYASSSNYNWSVTNGSFVSANDTARVTFGSSGTSTISVEETDVSGCIGDDDHTVTITPVLAISVALDPASACEGDNVAVEADPGVTPDNITYQWFVVDGTTGVATSVSGTNATNTITGSAISPGDDVRVVISSDYVCPDGGATDTANVTPTIHEIPEAYTQDLTLCEGSAGTLTAVDSNGLSGLTYQWYQNNSAISGATSATYGITNAQASNAGAYHVTISNSGCSDDSPQQTVIVTVAEVNITGNISDGDYINIDETASLSAVTNVTNNTGYSLTWTPFGETTNQVSYVATDDSPTTLTYTVTASIAGCTDQDDFTFYVIKPINPPNVITPGDDGGDGVNDVWILDGIETYPDIDIKIFNRWGNVIYRFSGTGLEYSNNPFDGTRNGEPLPVATYYYIIDLKIDNTVFNGHLSIVK